MGQRPTPHPQSLSRAAPHPPTTQQVPQDVPRISSNLLAAGFAKRPRAQMCPSKQARLTVL